MFAHLYFYRLKLLIRDRTLTFWTLAFPIILGSLFYLAFGKLGDHDNFKPIDVAVVTNDAYAADINFQKTLKNLSTGDNRRFDLTEATEADADALLADNKVVAYILMNPEASMVVRSSGINQNIVKLFLEQYSQTTVTVTNVLSQGTPNMDQVVTDYSNRIEYTKEVSASSAKPNVVLNYFYSLIAMACMYGSFWGLKEIMSIQANLSTRAARINMVPIHKLKVLLVNLSAATTIQFCVLLVLLAYLRFVLKIDFGSKTGFVLLTTFIGCILGILFGAFVSVLTKKGEGVKLAIMLGVSMVGSFLAGMMYDQMKYIIAQKAPIVAYLNPVNLLTDAFYCLYYFDTYTRYWLNIGILGIFIVIFGFVSYLILRRQKYASL